MDWQPGAGPFRAFRDRYVAPYAGVSYDLAPRAVGVHPDHLARVPELVGREVLVSHEQARSSPLHRRPAFRIVEVSAQMRDALLRSGAGVVFSVFDLDDPVACRLIGGLDPGHPVFLNAAVDRLAGHAVKRPDIGTAA